MSLTLGLHLAVLEHRTCDMPSINRPNRPINQLDGNIGLSKNAHLGNTHCNGLIDMKEYSLISHIESLKAAANGSVPFCHSNLDVDHDNTVNNNATRSLVSANSTSISAPSCHNEFPQIVPLSQITDDVESTQIQSTPPMSKKWLMDPDSVPGNLRRDAKGNQISLTLEEILSHGSYSTAKRYEFADEEKDDDNNINNETTKKVAVKHSRRKSAKSLRRKQLKNKDSTKSPLHGGSEGRRSVPSTRQAIQEIDGKVHTISSPLGEIACITALCKGIKIQEKQPSSISVKSVPYSRKTSVSNSTHIKNASSPFKKSLENAMVEYTRKSHPPVPHSDHSKKVSGVPEDNSKTTKVYLSEKQSGVISDCGASVPCAPPATPTPDQLKRYEYVPSLQDIRSQRSFRQRLQMMEIRAMKKEKKKQSDCMKLEKVSMREKRIELKKKQRQEIYALNKLMTDVENERFRHFMANAGSNL